jgi:hypothetical protein
MRAAGLGRAVRDKSPAHAHRGAGVNLIDTDEPDEDRCSRPQRPSVTQSYD